MTTLRPQRYDQCDDTCTVDCGHCKGKGHPDLLRGLRERLTSDLAAAKEARDGLASDDPAWMHRAGKVDGIKLALSYVDEALRLAQPTEEAAP